MTSRTASARAARVDRPALRERLDEALSVRLTTVIAPAGSGKTTLLAQWVASHPETPCARLDADDADNDPVRFATRMLDTLSVVEPISDGTRTLIRLHANGLGTALIDALGDELRRFPECVFIIDDLHRITSRVLLTDLARVLRILPAHVHVILSSRVDPPLPRGRSRADDALLEFRQADLALTVAEATQLLSGITGVAFSSGQIGALVKRTEGWAAGLQLAAVTLRHRDDPDEFIAQFNGTDRLIVDYLTEETLQIQTPRRRRALLRMSILDRMSAGLVNVVIGRDDAQLLLEELERESMFLVPLDTTRSEYRFHPLFQDMLRYRLRAADPALEVELLHRAATWHLDRDEVHAAVEYLLRAKDWAQVIDVVTTRMTEVYERGEMLTVINWIESIPEAVRADRLDAWLLLGMLWGMAGQTAKSEDILGRLLSEPRSTAGQRKIATTYLSAKVYFAGHPEVSVVAAERAIGLLAEDDGSPVPNLLNVTDPRLLETLTLLSGARAHFLAGNRDESARWAARTLSSRGSSYPLYRVGALGTRALIDAWAGRMRDARLSAHEALTLAREVGRPFHPVVADAYLALAQIALEQAQPRHAALPLREAIVRSASNRRDQLMWITRLQSAELSLGHPFEEDPAPAEGFAEEAATCPPPIVARRLGALRARRLRLRAAPDAAARELSRDCLLDPAVFFEAVAAALAAGHRARARALLADALPPSAAAPLEGVQRRILAAWLAAADGDTAACHHRLAEAFDLAEPEGLVDVFIRAGGTVLALVAGHTRSHDGLRRSILDRARDAHMPLPATDLLAPLTDRELQILTYLPSRYKNSELADLCFVSLSTIKTHLANIYRKLDATTRDAAIARAHEVGLL
ncbi:hypothetical protein F6J84_03655 [Microbacterium caowuchunii]|uniref:LuxR C-terminal-related transcriptional regulator n=1 Tax=Microbacterium caowuchunii TaxID=2614638 RepID=UPI001245C85D|nr:LuxR C-terminal-related transcriptional regulator [Microbacterium caowuchunii]QEV99300.1 hypothetical protein F6J84_03655 [Microbacterium caowuchunii]